MEVYHVLSGWASPKSVKLLWRFPHEHVQKLVSQLIQNPALLVIKMNSHAPFSPRKWTGFSGWNSYLSVAIITRLLWSYWRYSSCTVKADIKNMKEEANTRAENHHKGSACREIFKGLSFINFYSRIFKIKFQSFLIYFPSVEDFLFTMETENTWRN